jgi:hypothetical protein
MTSVFQWNNDICPKAKTRDERVRCKASKTKLDIQMAEETETIPVADVGKNVKIGNIKF